MFRKLSLAAVAVAALGAAALAPDAASARPGGWHGGWYGGGWHRGWGGPRVFIGGPAYYGGYGGCYVRSLGAGRPGARAGVSSTAATDAIDLPDRSTPAASARGAFALRNLSGFTDFYNHYYLWASR